MASLIQLTSTNIVSTPKNIKPQIKSYLKNPLIVVPNLPKFHQKKAVLDQINKLTTIPLIDGSNPTITFARNIRVHDNNAAQKMQTILELINDRIEMHQNICEQRENWNSLLLNSINMITLTATAMVGVAGVNDGDHVLALKVSSVLLFSAATGMLLIMNKIQPSQLVEEQRNAVRLFKQLKTRVGNDLMRKNMTEDNVKDVFERVLALDRAYPLPLLGAMLDKFPETFKPAKWWPAKKAQPQVQTRAQKSNDKNGWSKELEEEMREIVKVIKKKDVEDYERLGNKALKLNKMLATMGPLLTGMAAMGSAFSGNGGPWAGLVAAAAGSMASAVNTIEHGGQVGMVFEMYRNCAGFFSLVEETVESNLEECDFDKRENGELFEIKMALNLGRSLSELRDLAKTSKRNGGHVDEFASKLF